MPELLIFMHLRYYVCLRERTAHLLSKYERFCDKNEVVGVYMMFSLYDKIKLKLYDKMYADCCVDRSL